MALERIVDHIADDNPMAALAEAQRIRAAVSQLAQHPRMGRKGRVRGTFELIIQGVPYIVPYRINGQDVQILSVYHSSRKWPDSFG
jgi:toxin ParE1/3/4